MFDNIRGVITFSAVAAEPSEFLNAVKKSAVSVRKMRIDKNEISGSVYSHDFDELKVIGKKSGAEVTPAHKSGLIFTVKKYNRRYGLMAGFILALALVIFLSNIVLVVEVYGNESLSDESVKSLLSDYGIKIGSFIPGIDFRQTEKDVMIADDNLAWVGIRHTGSRVMVEVSERVDYPEMNYSALPCNIIAEKDAQIVGVENLYQGQLIPMLYDGVKKGDILVSGVIETTYGKTYMVHSMGDIIGRYTQKEVFSQSYLDERVDYLSPVKRKSIYLFGLRIPLYINKGISSEYEYDEKLNYLEVFNMSLPVGIVDSEYRPYRFVETEYTKRSVKEILDRKISIYEKNFLDGEDILIIDREVQFSENKEGMKAVVKYTLEGNIGVEQDILGKIRN